MAQGARRSAEVSRCPWAKSELSVAYHDAEWGVPVHDDRLLFEFLILEGAQAGLSWETILKKRDNYRTAFDNFDPAAVARYGEKKQTVLLANEGIVRNRLKIASAVQNALAFLDVQQELVLCHFCCDGWYPLGRRSRKTDLPGRVSWRSAIE